MIRMESRACYESSLDLQLFGRRPRAKSNGTRGSSLRRPIIDHQHLLSTDRASSTVIPSLIGINWLRWATSPVRDAARSFS